MSELKMSSENCGTAQRQSQISSQLEFSQNTVNELSLVINEFGKRLERVLRDPSPPNENTKEQEEDLVPVAADIRDIRRTIYNQILKLKDYLDRLEI